MNAPSAPAVSAAVPVAPVAMAAPLSATPRVTAIFDLQAGGQPADRIVRPALVVKSAPSVLRI